MKAKELKKAEEDTLDDELVPVGELGGRLRRPAGRWEGEKTKAVVQIFSLALLSFARPSPPAS